MTDEAPLVEPFKHLALRLKLGEAGLNAGDDRGKARDRKAVDPTSAFP